MDPDENVDPDPIDPLDDAPLDPVDDFFGDEPEVDEGPDSEAELVDEPPGEEVDLGEPADIDLDEAAALDALLSGGGDLPPVDDLEEEPAGVEMVVEEVFEPDMIEEPPTFAEPESEPVEEIVEIVEAEIEEIAELEPEPAAVTVDAKAKRKARKTKSKKLLKQVSSLREMRRKYGVKKKAARKAVDKGQLPARRVGKNEWLVLDDDARALWGKKGDPKSTREVGKQHRALDAVMTTAEVIDAFGLKKKKVRKAIKKGDLPARKSGDVVLVSRADAEALFS